MKFRHECKHYVTELDIAGLRSRMAVIAARDKYAGDNGIYTVKSLYFDNCYNQALSEKLDGVDRREKFRIRYYGNDSGFIRLEKKSKIADKCLKQTAPITKEEVIDIINGKTDWMLHSRHELIKELWAKMQYRILRPKTIVIYEREAYVYRAGNVRVTIDSNIRGSSNIHAFFDEKEHFPSMMEKSILEVKWDEFLPAVIADAVQLQNIKTQSFSKYAAVRCLTDATL